MMKSVSRIRCEGGSALVETISTLFFASVVLTSGLIAVYMAVAHLWLKRAAYETSICLSTSQSKLNCETQLRQTTSQALPVGHLMNIRLSRSRGEVKTRFAWLLDGPMEMTIDSTLSLPLVGPMVSF
jgi:hypothetical protein